MTNEYCPECHTYLGLDEFADCPNCGAVFGARSADDPDSDDVDFDEDDDFA